MPSRAWVVTIAGYMLEASKLCFNALTGLSCYWRCFACIGKDNCVSMPSRAWVVTENQTYSMNPYNVSMPSRAWVVTLLIWSKSSNSTPFQCPHGLELLRDRAVHVFDCLYVSMPSRAWVVTQYFSDASFYVNVSMPSRAWVVTLVAASSAMPTMFQCPHGLELLHLSLTSI